ncbi:MAG: hypothetical protein IKQ31_03880 [Clostridia bacterium]|nr:hypothetical protein [Clostridia bacterium]
MENLRFKNQKKTDLAAEIAANYWVKGMKFRAKSPYLDLINIKEEDYNLFITLFKEMTENILHDYEKIYNKYGEAPTLIISHIDTNTTSDIIGEAARQSNIPLKNLPSYSYTKFFIVSPKTILVDINTCDNNTHRKGLAITEDSHSSEKELRITTFRPEPGVELIDFIKKTTKSDDLNF